MALPTLQILGTRGVPAAHGGFETFAEKYALYMVERGWDVTVYCQSTWVGEERDLYEDVWQGVRRVHIKAPEGPFGTIAFDLACVKHAMKEPGVPLVLGYNTACFAALLRLRGRPMLINMDGIEWSRAKWSIPAKAWLFVNEWIGALSANKLISDHPAITDHLSSRRRRADIVTIPYGSDTITDMPVEPITALGLAPGRYLLSIGRIEPENSILSMIEAYMRSDRELDFVCLGALEPAKNAYHARVLQAAEGQVRFLGAIYDPEQVKALRFHCRTYCHGHTVGGTNPSLVEALGAGNPVIAHDNRFNRWVAGPGQLYFTDTDGCAAAISRAGSDPSWLAQAGAASRTRHQEAFQWEPLLAAYHDLCLEYADDGQGR